MSKRVIHTPRQVRVHVKAKNVSIVALSLIIVSLPLAAWAGDCSFYQIGLFPPVQVVPKGKEICGLRVDLLLGENRAIRGLDAGALNSAGMLRGIEVGGLVNRLKGQEGVPSTPSAGLQLAGLINADLKVPFRGLQVAGLVNGHDGESFSGIQLAGLLNDNDKIVMKGVQLALFSNQNYEGEISGIQFALFNQAQRLNGVQIGLGNGVSATEGGVAMVELPLDVLLVLGGGNSVLPFYNDMRAHRDASVRGIQIGAVTNMTEYLDGFQFGTIFNTVGQSMHGAQIAVIANETRDLQGLQLASVNVVAGSTNGLQAGGGNITSKDVTGIQIGLINVCSNLQGLQIGLINVVSSRFPSSVFIAPFINAGF